MLPPYQNLQTLNIQRSDSEIYPSFRSPDIRVCYEIFYVLVFYKKLVCVLERIVSVRQICK